MMTRVLYLNGDSDSYFAMDAQDRFTDKDLLELAIQSGGIHYFNYDEDELEGSIELKEFTDIDPDFINFISNNFTDYDESKHSDFIVLD